MVYLRSLTAAEPAMAAVKRGRAAHGRRLQVLERRRRDGHARERRRVARRVAGRAPGLRPRFPAAVIVSLAPMYASVFSVSTTVETAAPTLALPPTSSWPASVVTAD